MLDIHVSPLLNPVDFVSPPKTTVVCDSVWELSYCSHIFREVLEVAVMFPDQSRGTEKTICNLSHSIRPVTAVPFARRPSRYLPSWFTKLPFISLDITYQSHLKTPQKKNGREVKSPYEISPTYHTDKLKVLRQRITEFNRKQEKNT